MINFYPLKDCIMIPLSDEFDQIELYYYTEYPSCAFDAFVRKEYDFSCEKEMPLYLYKELWHWYSGENKYKKINDMFIVIPKKAAQTLRKEYLDKDYKPANRLIAYSSWKEVQELGAGGYKILPVHNTWDEEDKF